MRITQIAPLWERVSPPADGGIELIVGLLTDELVRRRHDITFIPLKMAGKVNPVDMEFFDREIKPQIDDKFIQFLGEADHCRKKGR